MQYVVAGDRNSIFIGALRCCEKGLKKINLGHLASLQESLRKRISEDRRIVDAAEKNKAKSQNLTHYKMVSKNAVRTAGVLQKGHFA